jgi:hypothetical protein
MRRTCATVIVSLGVSALAAAQPGSKPEPVSGFGTQKVSYYRIAAHEFSPQSSDAPYFDGSRYDRKAQQFSSGFVASPHLPDGARLVSIEFDYCDTSSPPLTLGLYFEDMMWDGSLQTPLAYLPSPGDGLGCAHVLENIEDLQYTVDNNLHQLNVRVVTSGQSSTSFTGAIVGYRLQVSPDPPQQTFGDVPVGHPQHQFVEALAATGVTAGCGGGNFCPNAPLTRGQMAVFLAKALGLQFQ